MTRQVSRIARSRTESQSGCRPCFGRVASTSWGATDPTQLVWTSAFSPASGELGLPSRRELGRGGLLRVLDLDSPSDERGVLPARTRTCYRRAAGRRYARRRLGLSSPPGLS